MRIKKSLCLLLALCLFVLCFLGCRKNKGAKVDEAASEIVEEVQEQEKEQEEPTGVEVSEEPMIIEIPEGLEVGGD